MLILGFIASVVIGISLGLIGGGGSILTVPILVYLFGQDPIIATSYSLFIVGLTSGVGAFSYFKNGLIHPKIALVFGLPSLVAVYLSRAYIVPGIPNTVVSIGSIVILKGQFLMILFALLMFVASLRMIKKERNKDNMDSLGATNLNYPLVILFGFLEGSLTGLVGAGGGFLIIPALVILCKLPMKMAVGTSLLIICVKSLIGFNSNLNTYQTDWTLLLSISAFAIAGIFLGSSLSKKMEGNTLKPAFGWFVLSMSLYVLYREIA